MKKSKSQVLFVGNHALKINQDIPNETLSSYDIYTVKYSRGSVLKNEPSKILINEIPCDYNGEYEIESLSIALDFLTTQSIDKSDKTILIGDPFELFFQAIIYGWLKENPKNVKGEKSNFTGKNDLTVVLIYPATTEFENMRKEISKIIYVLKKHKINTFLIESQINQASAIDNILYYYEPEEILQLEHKIRGIKQILGHVTVS